MGQPNFEHQHDKSSHEDDLVTFADKLHSLLPNIEFEEPVEMEEARRAVLDALTQYAHDTDFLRSVWIEYAKICEQAVDSRVPSNADPQMRAKLQIAVLVHKALILREIGDLQRYSEDLSDARNYAHAKHLDEVADVLDIELELVKPRE